MRSGRGGLPRRADYGCVGCDFQVRCDVTRENEWIFALQQQQVLIPTLKFLAAVRSQKAEFATVQRPKTARNACNVNPNLSEFCTLRQAQT